MYSAEDIRSLIEFEDTLNAQDAINFLEGLVKDIEEKEAHDTETIKSRFDPENLSIIKELVDSILYIQDIVGHSEGKVICDITGWRYAFKDEPEVSHSLEIYRHYHGSHHYLDNEDIDPWEVGKHAVENSSTWQEESDMKHAAFVQLPRVEAVALCLLIMNEG